MPQTLGILVNTDLHLEHVIGLVKAARESGRNVKAFFTHRGVRLLLEPDFMQAAELAEVSACRVSLQKNGIDPDGSGLPAADIADQSRHADLLEDCDRYVVL
jgi:hypothetical protein